MPVLTHQEIEGVVPGESLTKPAGKLPFEKPPTTSKPEVALQMIFKVMTEPNSARKLIKTLETGVPSDVVVDSMMMMLRGEGVVSPQAIPLIAPALVILVENLGKEAGIEVKRSSQPDPWTKPDEEEIEAIVAESTGVFLEEDETEEEKPEGLMTPPQKG